MPGQNEVISELGSQKESIWNAPSTPIGWGREPYFGRPETFCLVGLVIWLSSCLCCDLGIFYQEENREEMATAAQTVAAWDSVPCPKILEVCWLPSSYSSGFLMREEVKIGKQSSWGYDWAPFSGACWEGAHANVTCVRPSWFSRIGDLNPKLQTLCLCALWAKQRGSEPWVGVIHAAVLPWCPSHI